MKPDISLLAHKLFGEISGDRHAEFFALEGFHHQQNPEDQAREADHGRDQPGNGPGAHRGVAPEQKAEAENISENDLNNMQSAEYNDGLRGMEAYGGSLVNQQKDNSG